MKEKLGRNCIHSITFQVPAFTTI